MPTQSPGTGDFEEPELIEVSDDIFVFGRSGHDVDNQWFAQASRNEQFSAMHRWFRLNYCDPAEETPYNSEEGGYLYVHGGPYDAIEELEGRFGGMVDFAMIEHLAKELTSDGIYEWHLFIGDMTMITTSAGSCKYLGEKRRSIACVT